MKTDDDFCYTIPHTTNSQLTLDSIKARMYARMDGYTHEPHTHTHTTPVSDTASGDHAAASETAEYDGKAKKEKGNQTLRLWQNMPL